MKLDFLLTVAAFFLLCNPVHSFVRHDNQWSNSNEVKRIPHGFTNDKHSSVRKDRSLEETQLAGKFDDNYLMKCEKVKQFSEGYKEQPDTTNGASFGKFMALSKLVEQLTKSTMHFAEILTFAKLTNRTLVLPQCASGHIGSSVFFRWPVCLLFDVDRIGQYVDWVSEEYFLERIVKFGPHTISSRSVYFTLGSDICHPNDLWDGKMPHYLWNKNKNFSMIYFRSSPYQCSKNCPIRDPSRPPLSLVLEASKMNPDVLVLGKSTYFKCVDYEEQMNFLVPPPRVNTFVDRFIAEKLSSNFVAIQWRMEFSIRDNRASHRQMARCAQGLVSTVKSLTDGKTGNFTGVFIATDFTPDNVALSFSLEFAEDQRKLLLSTLNYIYTSLKPATLKGFYPKINKTDAAVWGLVDKLVCSRAKVFLFAHPICFGKKTEATRISSYTRSILEERSKNGWGNSSSRPWLVSEEKL